MTIDPHRRSLLKASAIGFGAVALPGSAATLAPMETAAQPLLQACFERAHEANE